MASIERIPGADPDDWGDLPAWLVAGLCGLSRSRLAAWTRTGLLTAVPGRDPSAERSYSWYQFERARVASRLLGEGLPIPAIRKCLDALDLHYREWIDGRAASATVRSHEIEVDGRVLEWRHADSPPPDVIAFLGSAAPELVQVLVAWQTHLSGRARAETVATEIVAQAPLGVLHEFNDRIEMKRDTLDAMPCLADTRMAIEFFDCWGVQELNEGFPELTVSEAQTIVDFNQALKGSAASHAAVA